MRSLIYGYGDTGKSFERYLDKKKYDYEIFDTNISQYNLNYDFQDFDQILCSPGIPKDIFAIHNRTYFSDLSLLLG